MISVRNLKKSFGSVEVLKGVNLDIAEKEVVVIIGPSGSGKSTLLRCLNYLEKPTDGEITVDGMTLGGSTDINKVGFMPQREGYAFIKWNTEPDGSGMDVLSTDTIRIDTLPLEADNTHHLYAQWARSKLLVTVYEATDVPYVLNVEFSSDGSSAVLSAISEAANEYQEWQDSSIGRAFNPDKLMAAIYQAGATRVIWGEDSSFDTTGPVEYTEIADTERCKGTITLSVIQPSQP